MPGIHPRNQIRQAFKSALQNAGFIDAKRVHVGGLYSQLEGKTPSILVYVANENPEVGFENAPRNFYRRPADVFIVIKSHNKNRESAIIEVEDLARECELLFLKPDSEVLDDYITQLRLADFQVSDVSEQSTSFSIQLIFRVNYNDKFLRG